MPVGNQPVILEVAANWIGQTIRHMEKNSLTRINATEKAVNAWSDHTDELWNSGFLSKPAEKLRSWFVGTNIPGKPSRSSSTLAASKVGNLGLTAKSIRHG